MKKTNKKGQAALYIVFIISSLFIILVAAFFAPMAIRFNTEMYKAGEKIMIDANESIQEIKNDTIREKYTGIIDQAVATTDTNITINSNLFRYGWILIIGLAALVVFLWTRSLVEVNTGRMV